MNQKKFIWNGYHNSSFKNIKNHSDPWLHLEIPVSVDEEYNSTFDLFHEELLPFIQNLPEKNIFNETTPEDFMLPSVFTKLIEIKNNPKESYMFSFMQVKRKKLIFIFLKKK